MEMTAEAVDAIDTIDVATESAEPIEQIQDSSTGQAEEPQQAEQAPEASDKTGALDKVDGRRFNPEWSRQLKELRESRPELADMLTKLRDGYARFGAINELGLKGVDDVRSLQTTINALGGAEKAAAMMSQMADIEAIDAR